jgi:hypothetical protein
MKISRTTFVPPPDDGTSGRGSESRNSDHLERGHLSSVRISLGGNLPQEEWPLFFIYIIVISGLQIKRSTEPGKIPKAMV